MPRMLKSNKVVTAVEIGTSKICVLIGETDEKGNIIVLAHGEKPSDNAVVKGEITDMGKVLKIFDAALREAEEAGNTEIDPNHVYMAVTGAHIIAYRGQGSIPINTENHTVRQEHIEEAFQSAAIISLPPEQETINEVEGEFFIDGRPVQNPLNQTGNKLEAHSHLICAHRNRIENFNIPLHEVAGVENAEPVFSALAAAQSVISEEASRRGVLLIDMGAGTTEFILFHNRGVFDSGVIPVGCNHIANDLALALDIAFPRCRRIINEQEHHKCKQTGLSFLEIPGTFATRKIPVDTIDKVIDLRLRETFELIQSRLLKKNLLQHIGDRVIICGGAAEMPETEPVLRSIFETPVSSIGKEISGNISGATTNLQTPRHCMVLGLLRHGLRGGKSQSSLVTDLDRRFWQILKSIIFKLKDAIKL